MSSAQPKVTGTFAKTPLLHVLTSLLEQGLTGTLVIETTDNARSALVVDRGVPVKMRLGRATLRLGEVLVGLGWVSRDAASASYEKSAKLGQLHGKVLVDDALIQDETLALALRSQLVKKLQWAAALSSDTAFGFYEAVDYLPKWRSGPTPVGPLVALWVLARSQAEPAVVATVLSRIAGRPLRLHQKAQLRCFGFDRTELTLLDVLRAKPQPMEALLRMGLVSPHVLERMIYVLTLARHLDFGRGLSPLGVGLVSEREESLLLPKESLHPSRSIVLSATTAPANAVRVGVDESSEIEGLSVRSGQGPFVEALDAIGVGSARDVEPAPKSTDTAFRPPAKSGSNEATGSPPGATPDVPSFAPPASRAATREGNRPLGREHRSDSSPPSRPAAMRAPAIIERRAQIEKLAALLDQQNHFEVLGLPRDVAAPTVQDTYLRLAKTYHPDRLPPELADLKSLATKIFSRLNEAHQTLTDATKREQYVKKLDGETPDNEEEKIRKVLRAAGSFQKAEVLLKKRMVAAAELEANRALEDDPEQPDYIALCAWIQACKPESESRLPELCRMLTESIHRNPNSEKNRFYRVQIYKRLGQIDKAVADCRIIVEKNPHHVDALREIRLWDMRHSPGKQTPAQGTIPPRSTGARPPSEPAGGSPPASKKSDSSTTPGGLLGRLFKR